MGHRLSKIYTRTGDAGTTGLADGNRVSKFDIRIETIGAMDETNSAIGFLLSQEIPDATLRDTLTRIQNELFDAGSELSLPGYQGIEDNQVEQLENDLDRINAQLPPLKEFVLPGGNASAASCHLARTAARRAERRLWELADDIPLNEALLRYMNRLSDYLFVAARWLARQNGGTEKLWRSPR